ncbi:hypothetical protein [Wukongibacter sp. M2B1]
MDKIIYTGKITKEELSEKINQLLNDYLENLSTLEKESANEEMI